MKREETQTSLTVRNEVMDIYEHNDCKAQQTLSVFM